MSKTYPEWIAKDDKVYSEDFTHDVMLTINGDFESNEQRNQYAIDLAEKLNTHAKFERMFPQTVSIVRYAPVEEHKT